MLKNCDMLIRVTFVMVFAIFVNDIINQAQVWRENYQPPTKWVEYYNVEAEKDLYLPGEDMYVISDLEVKRDVRLERSDVLYCNFDDRPGFDYERYVEFVSSSAIVAKGRRKLTKPRRYGAQLPSKPANCYINSCTVAVLDSGVTKTRCIQSDNIRFE